MSSRMLTTTISLDDKSFEILHHLKQEFGISQAAAIRQCIQLGHEQLEKQLRQEQPDEEPSESVEKVAG